MTGPLSLFGLFGQPSSAAIANVWSQRVQPSTGINAGPPPDLVTWLTFLDQATEVTDVRMGADNDRVSVQALLKFNGSATYHDGFPFVIASMPDVEFRILTGPTGPSLIQLFASMSDRGVEVVLEHVPVEILLPAGLLDPPADGPATPPVVGEFQPGRLDDLKIEYIRGEPAKISVHIRLHMNEQGEFDIRPAVPISFGKSVLSGIPTLAVHDFQLVPSPQAAPREIHWLRHAVTPWAPSLTSPYDGLFSIRSIHIDPDTAPIVDAANYLNSHKDPPDSTEPVETPPPPGGKSDAHAEFVLDDLVVPFFSPLILPVPRHLTLGVRRRVLDKNDPKQVFTFDNAPVRGHLSHDPLTGWIVESFFFKSPHDVTFDAAIVFGDTHDKKNKSDAMALGIGLEEDYTFTVSYKRDFSTTTGMPLPGTGAAKTVNDLLHFEIDTITFDIMTIKVGYSFGRHFGEHASFGASTLATIDLFVSMPPSGSDTSLLKLRALDGEVVKFIIEGLGWRLGSMHLEGAQMPDGVVLVVANRFGLVLQELGLRAEEHATYLSVSGGLQIDIPKGFTGSFLVKRLRYRISGDSGAPRVKLDGFFLNLLTTGFAMEAGGYYTETRTPDAFVREFALTGSIQFGSGSKAYKFGLDFLVGHTEMADAIFDYLFAQVFFSGSVPIGAVELRGVRGLYARNMEPKLEQEDKDSRELRYYTWYTRSDPLTVPGDRRLAAWVASDDSQAFGFGASVSFPGFGTVAELSAFVLYVSGPDEDGLFIVVEVRLLHNPKPVGYLAVEYDFKRDTWRGVLGVQLRLSDFVKQAPDWMNQIGALTGTLFISNDPPTVAIGHLADQKTWLLLHLDYELWVRSFFEAGFCFELVKGGPHGAGFFMRVEGGINAGVVRVVYEAGFGLTLEFFKTGSHDFAAEIWIEAALRVVLFGFLHLGVRASATFHLVGARPSRGEVELQVRFETPWFLPDVTFTLDYPFGDLAPGDLATSTSPLRAAGGSQGLNQKNAALHVERFDQAYANDRPSRTFSVNELQAGGPSEAVRLANFEADTAVQPIATDSTLSAEFAVAVNDKLALSAGVASNLGDQTSGSLNLSYDLVGIGVRRRARFGADRSWHALDQRLELPPDFSDPSGVKLSGSFGPESIAAHWDLDETIGDQPATKRLLINSATPFQFVTSNPAGDEELVRTSPLWPCCDRKQQQLRTHHLSFEHELIGASLGTRTFSASRSTITFTRRAVTRPQRAGTLFPTDTLVADFSSPRAGVIAHMDFDEDVAYCFVELAWSSTQGQITLVAFDGTGKVVGSRSVPTVPASDFQNVRVGAQGPIRRVEIRVVRPQSAFGSANPWVEIQSITYAGLTDFLDNSRGLQTCDGLSSQGAYKGQGKLAFLPNYEYEIELTTRVTVSHPSAPPVSANVAEYLYFKTKGLPGLNLPQRVGEEVEQYVLSAYGGGHSFLYRQEPAVLAFNEDFLVALPLALRPPGTAEEHATLMRMQLLVRADTAVDAATPFTATATDWIVDHRGMPGQTRISAWRAIASNGSTLGVPMRSENPFRARLATLTTRSAASCSLTDPRDVSGTVLVAPPQGDPDPDDPAQQLWPQSLNHTATVRLEGSPFVERIVFDPADLSALQLAVDAGTGDADMWKIDGGALGVVDGTHRRFALFGEATWNHFSVTVAITLQGAAAGVAIALPGAATPSEGLFALVEATATGRRLVLYRRTTGTEMTELAGTTLTVADPHAPVTLQVNAFDDRIQASVGEATVDAPRDEQREGRIALIATGIATFINLRVAGVPVYTFPFKTSRYRTFHEHITSWPGTLDVLAPDSLGPGTSGDTVAGLWVATGSDVSAAMQPDADPSRRDAVVSRWLKGLGLALKDEVGRVEISRYVVNDKTAALLIESPEPVDFTTEVAALLERRVQIIVDPPIAPADGGVVSAMLAQPTTSRVATVVPSAQLVDVTAHARGVDVQLAIHDVPTGGLVDDRVVLLQSADGGRLRVFTGRLRWQAGTSGSALVRAVESDHVAVLDPGSSVLGPAARLAAADPRRLVAIVPGISALGGNGVIPGPVFVYVPVNIRVLQNGTARRALIVPFSSANIPQPLQPGAYRLTLTMNRARWSTTAAADDLNRYRDSATLNLSL